jgi:hypothetical protein
MAKFWKDGLHFSCQQCGKCCTFQGGAIYATSDEFQAIADVLNISLDDFYSLYTVVDGEFISIKSHSAGPCIFYKKGCTIYSVRPTQCRTYPFWPEILKNKTRWENEAKSCFGINKGDFHNSEKIKRDLDSNEIDLKKS